VSDIGIALLSIAGLFALILSGVPVAFALIVTSLVAVTFVHGDPALATSLLTSATFESLRSYVFVVVPLFILMGALMANSRAATGLFVVAEAVFGRIRGGLAIATVGASAIFGALTGASVASAALFSRIATPQMVARGYDRRLAIGSVTGSSVLAMLIPPSVLMIIYGVLTQTSIGHLFIAGIVPGILLAVLYAGMIVVRATLRPALVGGNVPVAAPVPAGGAPRVGPAEASAADVSARRTMLESVPIALLILLVIGGIWGGVFTAIEASAVGAAGALVVASFSGLSWSGFVRSLKEAASSTSTVLLLIIGATMYSRMLAMTGAIGWFGGLVTDRFTSTLAIMLVFLVLIMLLGAIIDSISILLLTVPLMLPVLQAAGVDPLWWGVIMIVTVEMGLVTPPFGIVAFVVNGVLGDDDAPLRDVFTGSLPFLGMMIVLVVIMLAFPAVVTWLPSLLSR
jgi:tripartite ATP-independent transporter DctM subunit